MSLLNNINSGRKDKEIYCNECGHPYRDHGKDRVYPDDGPAGSWHYVYDCSDINRGDGQ